MTDHAFSPEERAAVYRAIAERRDMRHFAGGEVAPELLARLLQAAHQAPSVGLMQPWRFIRITRPELRDAIHGLVEAERVRTAEALGERSDALFQAAQRQGAATHPPLLVGGAAGYNVVAYKNKHYSVPLTLGPLDLQQLDLAALPQAILVTRTYDEALRAISEVTAS